MHEMSVGSLRLVVEDRAHLPGGGPTLRVYDVRGREVLRFDCFERGAHWHIDPAGCDERVRIDRDVDPVDWTLGKLRAEGKGLLVRAGVQDAPTAEVLERSLVEVERALRAVRSSAA